MSNTNRSVCRHLTAGGAVASAAILAIGLVVAPPNVGGARTEARAVQLATFALSTAALSRGLLEEFVSDQAQTVAPGAPALPGGAEDVSNADITAQLNLVRATLQSTGQSVIDPAIQSQQVNNAVTAAPPDWLTSLLSSIFGFLLNVHDSLPAGVPQLLFEAFVMWPLFWSTAFILQ